MSANAPMTAAQLWPLRWDLHTMLQGIMGTHHVFKYMLTQNIMFTAHLEDHVLVLGMQYCTEKLESTAWERHVENRRLTVHAGEFSLLHIRRVKKRFLTSNRNNAAQDLCAWRKVYCGRPSGTPVHHQAPSKVDKKKQSGISLSLRMLS